MSRAGDRGALGIALVGAAALAACVHAPPPAPPFDPGFRGPGRLLLLFGLADGGSALWSFDAGGPRELPVAAVREARWVTRERVLVVTEVPPPETYGLPGTRLRLLEPATGETRPVGSAGRHYDAEPSPDGAWLAVCAEVGDRGDSDLEIWSLEGEPARVARRAQSLEEPRWRHDGRALAASVLMADPESDDASGGSFGGTSLVWPRLHRLRRDLGEPALLFDGEAAGRLAPGGSLALWWDARGLFARQRAGLVRCDPRAGGCALVYAPGADRRIVDGRPVGPDAAWLLSLEARDAFDRREPDAIHRVDLASGRGEVVTLPPGVAVLDLDWIAD